MEAVSVAVVGVVVVVVSEVASATLARRCWKGDFVDLSMKYKWFRDRFRGGFVSSV